MGEGAWCSLVPLRPSIGPRNYTYIYIVCPPPKSRERLELGDKAWRELLEAHDATVRREVARFRGSEVKSLGDGFLILFDGPARAIHCAQAITEAMAPLGIKVRAGLHTGEVERTESDVLGIAVHLAARIMDTASASEVVISRTVKDLVAGSGIAFDDAGEHSLKGIEEKWQLLKVRTIA